MNTTYTELENLLKTDERFVSQDGKVMRNAVYEAANKMDEKLLALLIGNPVTKKMFFKEVVKTLIFDKQEFNFVISNQEMLPDSYTAYKQDIGLIDSKNDFISSNNDVVLSFPFKDCVLEFDSTDPDQKREEVFINEVLGRDEIDHLFEKKVLTAAKLINKDGEKEIKTIHKDSQNNLLIKGNNLFAMYSLLPQYKGQIKLMYWDVLYNTESDQVPYADSFKHSSWLTMMKNRLQVAKQLLKDDGVICIQCDDNEMAYLKVLMDEIFGRDNFLSCVVNQSAKNVFGLKASSKGKTIVKIKDYILVYKADGFCSLNSLYTKADNHIFDTHDLVIEDSLVMKTTEWFEKHYSSMFEKYGLKINRENIEHLMNFDKDFEQEVMRELISKQYSRNEYKGKLPDDVIAQLRDGKIVEYEGKMYMKESNGQGLVRQLRVLGDSCKVVAGEIYKMTILGDIWDNADGYSNINVDGQVKLKNGKKPEILMQKVIEMFTSENDMILDAYMGSGTTGAVAMKMGRKFIGIEQLDTHVELAKTRLKNVINGDQTGISKSVNWQGGGEFIYCELKKLNQYFIDEIAKAKTKESLVKIWERMHKTGFINCFVNIDSVGDLIENVGNIDIDEIKKILINTLDKNQLYVNYSDIEDEDFDVSLNEKNFTNSFYGVSNESQ